MDHKAPIDIMTTMAAPEPATSDVPQLSALVAHIAVGDHAALAKLYDATSRTVYGLALRIVAEPASAEEIALDVYMQVWRTASSCSAARGSVNAWLVTLTRSRAGCTFLVMASQHNEFLK